MKQPRFPYCKVLYCIAIMLCSSGMGYAQVQPPGGNTSLGGLGGVGALGNRQGQNNLGKDSTLNKQGQWKDERAKIYFSTLGNEASQKMDTSIALFHHYAPQAATWFRDLGNYGSPMINLLFDPILQPGPRLGYNAYEQYIIPQDSLPFYNTTRPYSQFDYHLGSKTEQEAAISHTQNINRRFNVALRLRNINSPGFFRNQQTRLNNGYLTANWISENSRYSGKAAVQFYKFKTDENGGLENVSDLTNTQYADRIQLPTTIISNLGTKVSSVQNQQRDVHLTLQNNYSWGVADTLYNADSTSATPRFTPRFRLTHTLDLESTRHRLVDLAPERKRYNDALRINIIFNIRDTLQAIQNQVQVQNKFGISGFVGRPQQLLRLSAGIANRIDQFKNIADTLSNSFIQVNNFIFAELYKDQAKPSSWAYSAAAKFYATGTSAGDFHLQANAGKEIEGIGGFRAQIKQTLSTAPYSFSNFTSNFFVINNPDLGKVSHTLLQGSINVSKLGLELGVTNHLLANFIYINEELKVTQQSAPFTVTQLFARNKLNPGKFVFYTDAIFQLVPVAAPVNVPALLIRHITSYQARLFKGKLQSSTGVELRYHSPYKAAGYTPFLGKYYYQNTIRLDNPIAVTAFFNFKVGQFRAFISGDNLQQLVVKKNILNAPFYPTANALFRFGFSWVLIN